MMLSSEQASNTTGWEYLSLPAILPRNTNLPFSASQCPQKDPHRNQHRCIRHLKTLGIYTFSAQNRRKDPEESWTQGIPMKNRAPSSQLVPATPSNAGRLLVEVTVHLDGHQTIHLEQIHLTGRWKNAVDPQVMGIFWDPPQIIIESSHQSISIPSSPGYLRGSTWWLSPDRIFGDESSHHHPISSPAPPPFGFHWESVCSKGVHLEETRKRSYLRIHTFSHGAKKITIFQR